MSDNPWDPTPRLLATPNAIVPQPNPTLHETLQYKEDLTKAVNDALVRFGELTGLTVDSIEITWEGQSVEGDKLKIHYKVEVDTFL